MDCVICGTAFVRRGPKKTCSPECAKELLLAYQREYHKNYRSTPEGWAKGILYKLRSRNKEYGFPPCDLDWEDLLPPEQCPILGIPLEIGDDTSRNVSPSVDRLDPTKGYMKGNVRVISLRANRLKQDSTIEELEAIIRYMKEAL